MPRASAIRSLNFIWFPTQANIARDNLNHWHWHNKLFCQALKSPMSNRTLGEWITHHPWQYDALWISVVFVTGNANKLLEVRAILASSAPEINLESRDLDSEWWKLDNTILFCAHVFSSACMWPVPEIQGTTQEVAKKKCRQAAELVGFSSDNLFPCENSRKPRFYIDKGAVHYGGYRTLLQGFQRVARAVHKAFPPESRKWR